MQYKKYPLKPISIIGILTIYFIIDYFVVSPAMIHLAFYLDPNAKNIAIEYQIVSMLLVLIPCLILAYPLFKVEKDIDTRRLINSLWILIVCLITLNVLFSYVMMLFDLPLSTLNQNTLIHLSKENKYLFLLMAAVLAPLLEEVVFRGVIFRFLRNHTTFIISACITGFIFGFMHIFVAVLLGNYNELFYIILYGGIGMIFCFMYEYNKSIFACVYLHALYNFISALTIFL